MVDLPKKKVGIVACSGEELPEGTVTRLAALKVLEQLRPADTVTICLPLFLAGGEGDRAFAKFYPTIAVDGCEQRCAARATEKYSNKPAGGIVVTELVAERGLDQPAGLRQLDKAGLESVDAAAQSIAAQVDELLGVKWSRQQGAVLEEYKKDNETQAVQATCECGSGIPVQVISINGQKITLVGLPLIFQQFLDSGKPASDGARDELMDTVKIYNAIPPAEETLYSASILQAYADFCAQKEAL
jgi:hypothetical protein